MRNVTFLLLLLLLTSLIQAQPAQKNLLKTFHHKGFLENKGQITDPLGEPNNKIKYLYSEGTFNLAMNKKGFSYELFHIIPAEAAMDESGHSRADEVVPAGHLASSSRIDVIIEGANPKSKMIPANPTGAYYNFYDDAPSKNPIEHVNAFNSVMYQDIYPGIDLVFTASDEKLKTPLHYDFIIHPGADANQIQLKYSGASTMEVKAEGTLQFTTKSGYVEEGKPVSFLEGTQQSISSSYHLFDNVVSYNVANYDRNKTLVIDPTLIWGTYYGGEDIEEVAHIHIDSKSKPLITGNTLSTFNIATTGAYQTVYGGDPADLYIAKFDTNGVLAWASYFGGTGKDFSYGVTSDALDNVILIGKSESEGLATMGQTSLNGIGDAIIAKFSAEGIFQWSTYKGGPEDDHFRNCIADEIGNIYLAGYTESSTDIATAAAFQTVYGGEGDCMVAKYSPDGNLLWCTYLGTLGQDRFHAVNLDLFGHVLTQGTTGSTSGLTTTGVHQEIYGGGEEDVLLAVFDTLGQRIWCTYYGGEYSDRGRGVESDSTGNIYIGGLTESELGIATPGAHQEEWTEGYYSGNLRAEDGYLAKFTPEGQLTWGTYYGASGYDRIWGICLDSHSKFIYTVGGTKSEDSIANPEAWQPIKGGGADGFFAKWDFEGNLIWGSYLGANSEEHLEDVDVDSAGFIYLLGQTDKNEMFVTAGAHQTNSNGSDEATLHKFYAGLDCFDYNEPNDSLGSAGSITSWLTSDSLIFGYSGNIVNSNDQDWFQIEVTIDQPDLMVTLSALTQNYSLNLFNAQQMLLATSSQFGTLDTLIANNLLAGTYYISIAHDSASYSANCYLLKAFKSAIDFATQADNGISSNGTSQFMTIFPNPASEVLSFSLMPSLSSNATLVVYDLLGRIKKSEMLHLKQGYQIIDLKIQDLPSGIYNIVVKSNSNTWKATFIR